jgi:hypothetical protein
VPRRKTPKLPLVDMDVRMRFSPNKVQIAFRDCSMYVTSIVGRKRKNPMKKTAMKIRCLFFLIAAAFVAFPAGAQLAPANSMGVTMGHIHLFVKDVEAQKHFWTAEIGGIAVQNGPLLLIQFPGTYIMLRQAETVGPPKGPS